MSGHCANAVGALNPQPAMPEDEALYPEQLFPGWCSNFVGIRVSLTAGGTLDIIENTSTEMMDVPLAVRTAHAASVWKRELAKRLQQEDLQKSKQAKPNL